MRTCNIFSILFAIILFLFSKTVFSIFISIWFTLKVFSALLFCGDASFSYKFNFLPVGSDQLI